MNHTETLHGKIYMPINPFLVDGTSVSIFLYCDYYWLYVYLHHRYVFLMQIKVLKTRRLLLQQAYKILLLSNFDQQLNHSPFSNTGIHHSSHQHHLAYTTISPDTLIIMVSACEVGCHSEPFNCIELTLRTYLNSSNWRTDTLTN